MGKFAGVLKQIQRALKPDGVFMGSMIGGDSLFELRCVASGPELLYHKLIVDNPSTELHSSWQNKSARAVSALVSPPWLVRPISLSYRYRCRNLTAYSDPSDASNLMGRAGFSLLTVDVEDVKINYPSMWELMEDLRDMGESNAVLGR